MEYHNTLFFFGCLFFLTEIWTIFIMWYIGKSRINTIKSQYANAMLLRKEQTACSGMVTSNMEIELENNNQDDNSLAPIGYTIKQKEYELVKIKSELSDAKRHAFLRDNAEFFSFFSDGEERISDEQWKELEHVVLNTYPEFRQKLFSVTKLSKQEYRICLLVKANIAPVQMSKLLMCSKQTIASVRYRLYQKAFGEKGSASDWDAFIVSL